MTLRALAAAVGWLPAGIVLLLALVEPVPLATQAAAAEPAEMASAARVSADASALLLLPVLFQLMATTVAAERPSRPAAPDQLLAAVMVTGIVNTAPWHASGALLSMLTEPVRVVWVVPLTPPLAAATTIDRPVWLVNETLLPAQPECDPSAAIEPLVSSDTAVTLTGYGFGLLNLTSASPDTPG